MTFANPLPWWLFLPALALAGVLAHRAYAPLVGRIPDRVRLGFVTLRFVLLTAILVMLMRPVIVLPAEAGRDRVVAILVDASRSMRIEDADGEARLALATRLVHDELIPGLSGAFTLETFAFGDRLAPHGLTGLDGSDRRSDLSGALTAVGQRYDGRTLAGVIVLSDGGDTEGRDVVTALAGTSAPVYPIPIGEPVMPADREVVSVTAGTAALEGAVVRLDTTVVSHGFGDEPFDLRILENGRPVDLRRVKPGADGAPVHESFLVSPAPGVPTVYAVDLSADPREFVPDNNRRAVLVQPPGRPRKVLVVQGAPGYDHSFMMRALGQDAGLRVDAVVRKGGNDAGEPTYYVLAEAERAAQLGNGFPASRQGLFGYDALIIANVEPDQLRRTELEWSRDFVSRRGGGLLVLGADSFRGSGWSGTALADLIPLDPQRQWTAEVDRGPAPIPHQLVPTLDGERHPVLQLGPTAASTRERWAAMPALGRSIELGGPRSGAIVLATAVGAGGARYPLVAVQPYGLGRAMVIGAEGTWLWRMRTASTDRTFETFWQQVARWLATQAPTAVTVTITGGESIGGEMQAEVVVRDENFDPVVDADVRVAISGPGVDGEAVVAELVDASQGRYRVPARAEQAGVYRAVTSVRRNGRSVEAPDAWALVGGADPELTDPRRNDEVLRRVADATGGRLIGAHDVAALTADFRAGSVGDATPRYRDLWHSIWTFGVLLAMLSAEWIGRRRLGLR